MSSIFQNIDFNVLPAKSQSLFMRIKGHIDCVALDAPADILRNGFPITRDIHGCLTPKNPKSLTGLIFLRKFMFFVLRNSVIYSIIEV